MKKKHFLSDSDAHYVVKDAEKILAPDRRRLLQQGLTLGGIMMLTGCDISNNDDIEKALFRISRFNDRIQSFLFSKNSVAPEYLPEDITTPFPFNAFYGEEEIPVIDGGIINWKYGGWYVITVTGFCLNCITCSM